MKRFLIILAAGFISFGQVFAGNPERAGQAGATQLLVNSWARNSGLNGINIGAVSGIEAIMVNPAGLATTRRTELVFAHTRWLVGADINVNSFGFSQSLKNAGVIGLFVTAFDMGEFVRTTEQNPDGELGTFSPTYMNMGLSYAKKFTDHIYVGATVKIIHEAIFDVKTTGLAFDAGVQYRTNLGISDSLHADRLKIGISVRNIGPTMKFAGDGLTFRGNRGNDDYSTLASRPAEDFEIPTVLNMGLSYDFYLGASNRITAMGAFLSNAFATDQFGVGIEYGFKKFLMVRYSFLYEKDILTDERMTAFTGHAAGVTVEIPFKTGQNTFSSFGLDYSYRSTNPFNGVHSLGVRIDL